MATRASVEPAEARPQLPAYVVWAVVLLTAAPLVLNLCGVDFSTPSCATPLEPVPETELVRDGQACGEEIHLLLEWTAFCLAVVTGLFALLHYYVKQDAATPIIGAALFFSGMMDGFNVLAARGLIHHVVDNEQFIPFTWAVSRTFNVCIVLAGTILVLRRGIRTLPRDQTGLRLIVLTTLLFGVVAFAIVQTCSRVPALPLSLFPGGTVPRPWDGVALVLYLFVGGILLPRFYRAAPSLFSHALALSLVPHIAAQLHAAFGSGALYDNHFHIAEYLKLLAYAVPLVGLFLEYTRAYRAELAGRAAETNLRLGREVQQRLLSREPPKLPGAELAAFSQPAEAVGGDYVDMIPLADGRCAIVVADVSGHDVGASIFMAQTRAYLRALLHEAADLPRVIQRLNAFLGEDARDQRFVTMFFGVYDPTARTLVRFSAGQTAYRLAAGEHVEVWESDHLPLGIADDLETDAGQVCQLEPGDIVVAFTDGISESVGLTKTMFGSQGVLDAVRQTRDRPAAEIVSTVVERLRTFVGGTTSQDDLTLLVLKVKSTST